MQGINHFSARLLFADHDVRVQVEVHQRDELALRRLWK